MAPCGPPPGSATAWDKLLSTVDVQDAFDQYYAILWNLLEIVYPQKSITSTNCDPKFITPQIKSLLRSRNRLMHKGKTHAADSITTQISRKIVTYNASRLSVERGSKELWQTGRELTGRNKQGVKQFPVDAGTLNKHYATISTDQKYSPPLPELTVNKFTVCFSYWTPLGIPPRGLIRFHLGFFAYLSPLLILSLSYSAVPTLRATQWKSSSSTPVPKVPQRHSRRLVRTSGQSLLLQSSPDWWRRNSSNLLFILFLTSRNSSIFFQTILLSDQLVRSLRHWYTSCIPWLTCCKQNLRCTWSLQIFLKLSTLCVTARFLPNSRFFHYLIACTTVLLDYFSNRRHCTWFMSIISGFLTMSASIIQGTGIGPVSYVVNASDLKAVCLWNKLF